MLQHGAYFTLLNNYYITGGPLPENAEHLTRLCGAHSSEEIEAISFVLTSFFSLKSDGWHNKKADAEIREAKRISKIRRDARLGKRKTNVNQVLPVCGLHPHPHTQKEEPKVKSVVHFVHPTLEDVAEYCQSRGGLVDPQRWFDHYSANGWRVGRNTMKDWRAAVRNWERNGASNGTNRQASQSQRQPTIQVERYHNNRAEIERAFGAAVGGYSDADGAGQKARVSSGNGPLLEGKVD